MLVAPTLADSAELSNATRRGSINQIPLEMPALTGLTSMPTWEATASVRITDRQTSAKLTQEPSNWSRARRSGSQKGSSHPEVLMDTWNEISKRGYCPLSRAKFPSIKCIFLNYYLLYSETTSIIYETDLSMYRDSPLNFTIQAPYWVDPARVQKPANS